MIDSFFPKQAFSAAHATSHTNIWEGPIRAGKTVGSLWAWAEHVMAVPRNSSQVHFLVGNTLRTMERNVLLPMRDMMGEDVQYSLYSGKAWITGIPIHIVTAHDASSFKQIRGSTCATGYGDELTLWPQSFYDEIHGRMSLPWSRFYGTTNPDSPFHYLKTDHIDKARERGINVYKFDIHDNAVSNGGFLDDGVVDKLKKSYSGLYYKRLIEGRWVLAEGIIYEMFSADRHVIPTLGRYYQRRAISIDYGARNPFCAGVWHYSTHQPREAVRVDGYWYDARKNKQRRTDVEHAKKIVQLAAKHGVVDVCVDPSALGFSTTLQTMAPHLNVVPANNAVKKGIENVSLCLEDDDILYLDVPANEPVFKEYTTYIWDENKSRLGLDVPLKQNDHAMDESRYFVNTFFEPGNTGQYGVLI